MKIRYYLPAAIMLLSLTATDVSARTFKNTPATENVAVLTPQQVDARIQEMKLRVAEIRTMDKSSLTRAQRKDLRLELKNMNREARGMGRNGIYISVGALIIIILLLILIF
jgi:hypothetical protein